MRTLNRTSMYKTTHSKPTEQGLCTYGKGHQDDAKYDNYISPRLLLYSLSSTAGGLLLASFYNIL